MENKIIRVVYILDTPASILDKPEGITELKVVVDSVEQQGDWILAVWHNKVVGGVKAEHLKAFYLEAEDIDINSSEYQGLINENRWLTNENRRLQERVKLLRNDLINESNKRLEDLLCKSDK